MKSPDKNSQPKSQAQVFGGPWSLIKVEIVEKYMSFFNKALIKQPFARIYIDAFAGSGEFRFRPPSMNQDLFGSVDDVDLIHAGSAQRALTVKPPFDKIWFIEKGLDNVRALEALITKYQHDGATARLGDANQALTDICNSIDWKNTRGVIFLDPFGMTVDWPTLETIASTQALDMWFLFALAGTNRNLPGTSNQLDATKRDAVNRVLGTEDWYEVFYKKSKTSNLSLLDEVQHSENLLRVANIDDVEKYVRQRLLTIFPHVSEPKRLKAQKNQPLFSLFFAVSNPNRKAIDLASQVANHILKKA